MGTMVITGFSTSQTASSYTINISGKDKMCLLNGDLGGSLFASVDFGKEEIYDTQTRITTIKDIPIKTIIREAVHEYASELWENIIINDLDDLGLELLDYKGNLPLYLLIAEQSGSNEDLGDVKQLTLNGDLDIKLQGATTTIHLNQLQDYQYNPRTNLDFDTSDFANTAYVLFTIGDDDTLYSAAKVEQGQTCGYRYTDITYVGDLILGVGSPVTAMLDKLVAMLGN
jgi:hypothetical protein